MEPQALAIDGDIISANINNLRVTIQEASRLVPSELVMDLGRTTMVDSSGIGLLIQARNSLAGSGKTLRLIHVKEEIARMFRMMRLDHHFTIET
jgi:anti-anti-sigma factor